MTDSLHAVTPHELALFSERIARSLAERPLELGAEEHRERVAAMLREVGGATFYQLLSLGPTASPEKVHEGYERVARLVHPSHAPSLGLEGREGVLEVLFERATAAYVTLSHPGKRRDYDREIGPAGWPETAAGKSRAEENRDRARGYFNRATAFAAKDDFHFAIELLREAVRIDPQAKYFVLLGDLQTRNQHWLRHALDSYARALEIGGPDPQVEEAILRVRQRMTDIAAGLVPQDDGRAAVGNGARSGQGSAAPAPAAADDGKRQPPSSPLSRTGVLRYEIEADGSPAPFPDDPPPDER
ncbi:MAG TPA: DnaJ domain-containing protein [Thermoanaerobaculia bacterium]|nr:DnaJ domain-containing protein [Thermoanaerobaculia bacterium]